MCLVIFSPWSCSLVQCYKLFCLRKQCYEIVNLWSEVIVQQPNVLTMLWWIPRLQWGIVGAAVATTLAQYLGAAVYLQTLWKRPKCPLHVRIPSISELKVIRCVDLWHIELTRWVDFLTHWVDFLTHWVDTLRDKEWPRVGVSSGNQGTFEALKAVGMNKVYVLPTVEDRSSNYQRSM